MTTPAAGASITVTRRQRSRAARAAGYTVAVVINSILLYVVNIFPTWEAVPFLVASAATVVPILNLALTVGTLVSLINVLVDRRWMRAATEILTSLVSLIFIITTWTVFPFAFDESSIPWELVTRVILGFAAAGCVISVIVQLVALIVGVRRVSSTASGAMGE